MLLGPEALGWDLVLEVRDDTTTARGRAESAAMSGRVGGVGLLLRSTFGDNLLVRRAAGLDRGLLA